MMAGHVTPLNLPVERVAYKQVYDLVFKSRNAKLNSVAYTLDYLDWVKAGIAFNTRGFQVESRKISVFVGLYNALLALEAELAKAEPADPAVVEKYKKILGESLPYFYQDIFEIYQDHLISKAEVAGTQRASRGTGAAPDFGQLIILPSFDYVPYFRELFDTVHTTWDGYDSPSSGVFDAKVKASIYLNRNQYPGIYSCMLLMYDYSKTANGANTLLEVQLWEQNSVG